MLEIPPERLKEFRETGAITHERMHAVDANAQALGVSGLQLMESAGSALAGAVRALSPSHVLVLCGRGNNGSDGMVAARHLQHDADVDVLYLEAGVQSESCTRQLLALRHCRVRLHPFACREDLEALGHLLRKADVIVDSLLGTGASGRPKEPIASCIAMANAAGARIISTDVPTPGIRADTIVAFHREKVPGSVVAEIGIPIEAEICTGPGEILMIPRRDPHAHKGIGGEVLVIGGGPYQGAPYLAGLGALRAGADIVRIASPAFEPIPDLIYERIDGPAITLAHIRRLTDLARKADAVVCGNGLGESSHAVVTAIGPVCRRAVFDADALRLPVPVAAEETIYTPHAGEFARVTGTHLPKDLYGRAKAVMGSGLHGTVILKGHTDIISDGCRARFNHTGHPAMTVGGTGDVLAGICGALLCHLPAFEAACIAAYANGLAGEAAAASKGSGLIASDVIERIPEILFAERE